jgi:aminomethyltransferase
VFDVQMINVSNDYSLISVQGPKSINVLQSIFDFDMNTIKYYNFIFSDGLIISNTGYTGCGGFEIYCKNEKASDLWDKIFKVGKNYNIKAIGLAARDTLRLEMGFCLYGNDIDDESSPIEAGLSWITKTDKVFTSSELFKNQKENGVSKKLIGFKMLEKAIPRKDYEILNTKNEIIGKVTSGTMSPSLGFGIGLGYVKCGFEKIDTEIYIKIRKNIKKAIIVKTPFK